MRREKKKENRCIVSSKCYELKKKKKDQYMVKEAMRTIRAVATIRTGEHYVARINVGSDLEAVLNPPARYLLAP